MLEGMRRRAPAPALTASAAVLLPRIRTPSREKKVCGKRAGGEAPPVQGAASTPSTAYGTGTASHNGHG